MRFVLALVSGGALASLCVTSLAQSTSIPNAPVSQVAPQTPGPASTQPSSTAPSATAPLKLEDLPPDPHTPTPEEAAAQEAARQRVQIQQLAMALNKWGPADSTTGLSLSLKEMGRTKTANGTEITYQIQGTGFTPDMKLTLLRWPLNQGVAKVMDGVIVNTAGIAVCDGAATSSCSKTLQAQAPVVVTATVAKGEAVRVALIADDKKHVAAVSLVPFPIASEDRGCKLEVVRGAKNNELVLVEGDGFAKATNFNAGSESFGEKHPLGANPTAAGHFVVAMTPWVTGHDEGDTVIYAQTDSCSPTLSFHWGKDTYKVE